MNKKICSWLSKEGMSGVQIRDNGNIYSCPIRWINLIEDKEKEYYSNYLNLSLNDIQQKREQFLEDINTGKVQECLDCPLLLEADNEKTSIGPIKHLIYHPHTLCSLNCKYCFYTDEQRSLPIDAKYKKLDETIKHFYEIGLLNKEQFALDLGGGEPLLLDNIKETLDFMSTTWQNSTFYLLSNSTVVNKVNEFIGYTKNNYANIHKVLITSIDCGTAKTYSKIRKKDYFYDVIHNLYNYATNDIFDEIILKYIFLDDGSNLDDDNIYGFLRLCRFIADSQKREFKISLDIDWIERKHHDIEIPDNILKTIAKMKYIITDVMNLDYIYASDYLSPSTKEGINALTKIDLYIKEFRLRNKTYEELYELRYLYKNTLQEQICLLVQKIKDQEKLLLNLQNYLNKPTFLQNLFSVRNEAQHKVIRIFGLKLKFRRKKCQ